LYGSTYCFFTSNVTTTFVKLTAQYQVYIFIPDAKKKLYVFTADLSRTLAVREIDINMTEVEN